MSIFGAILSAASSLLGVGSNKRQSRRDTRHQMSLNDQQQEHALEQMEVQHGYNLAYMAEQQRINKEQYDYEYRMESPQARVQQLKKAGLNEGLMYGAGGSGMQGSVGTVSAPSSSTPGASNGSAGSHAGASYDFGSALALASDIERKQSESDYFDALANKVRSETPDSGTYKDIQSNIKDAGELENSIKRVEVGVASVKSQIEVDQMRTSLENMRKEGRIADKRYDELSKQIELLDKQIAESVAREQNFNANTKLVSEKIISERYQQSLIGATIKKVSSEEALNGARARQVDKEIERIGKQMELTDQQIKDLKNKRAHMWATFGVNTLLTISQEARSWATFGLAKGAQQLKNPQDYESTPGSMVHDPSSSYDYMFAD